MPDIHEILRGAGLGTPPIVTPYIQPWMLGWAWKVVVGSATVAAGWRTEMEAAREEGANVQRGWQAAVAT
jgi:hypothetical protein